MPSGKTHDQLTIQTATLLVPTTLIAALSQRASIASALATAAIASLAAYVSGIWLSPDVDSPGYLKRRYGELKWLWRPYYKVCHLGGNYRVRGVGTHRSHLSHSPIVGSVTRAAYISLPLLLFGFLAGVQPGAIAYLLQGHPREVLGAAIGLEVASLVHIISDWIWSELH